MNENATDPIYTSFLHTQFEEGMALAEQSDLLTLTPVHGEPPDAYIASFECGGLMRDEAGEICETDRFDVGIRFPSDYVRRVNPFEVLTWLGPKNAWHPNIRGAAHAICVGKIAPGTSLVDLLYQVFEIVTYKKFTPREDDALNLECCSWARANLDRFPIDARPLKRRKLNLNVNVTTTGEES